MTEPLPGTRVQGLANSRTVATRNIRVLKRVFIYVRVSDMKGRDANVPSTHTLRIQREQCEALATKLGVEVVDVIEHRDVSASRTRMADRLGPLLQRIIDGEADGLLVYRASRFTRRQAESVLAIQALKECGAHLRAVEADFDIHQPASKMVLDNLIAVAEYEAETRALTWGDVHSFNVRHGRSHKNSFGYVKREHPEAVTGDDGLRRIYLAGSLERDRTIVGTPPNPRWWWAREIFLRRAMSHGIRQLRRWLDDAGVLTLGKDGTGTTPCHWADSTIANHLQSRVYRGELHFGPHWVPNLDAHEALVSEEEWQAANSVRIPRTPPAGHKRKKRKNPAWLPADDALLTGLVRCAECRYMMTPLKNSYQCRGGGAGGRCPHQSAIHIDKLDAYVEALFKAYLEDLDLAAQAADADDEELVAALAALSAAGAEFEALRAAAASLLVEFTEREYLEMVQSAREKLKGCQDRRDALLVRRHSVAAGPLLELWPDLSPREKRALMAQAYGAVFVRPARLGDGRPMRSVAERVLILRIAEVDALIEAKALPVSGQSGYLIGDAPPLDWR